MLFEKQFPDLRKAAVAAMLLTAFVWCGRSAAAPGPLALGGAPGQSSGLYRVTSGGDLVRIWREGSAWQCLNLAKWGAPLGQDTLISGERGVIYGVNQEGRMFDTYFNGPVSRFATIDVTSGLLPRTLALGGGADGNTGVYGVTASGGIARAWWSGNPGWSFETVPTWGGRIVAGSLIAGEDRVYGVNEFGKLVNTYPDSGAIKFGVIEGRSDLAAGSLALGGSNKLNTGVYGITNAGLLVRAFWNNGAWSFQTASAAGSRLAKGSLISAYGSVYGLNTKGQIVLGYVDGSGTLKTSVLNTVSGLVPGSLALGGPMKSVNDIYGMDAKGQLIRTYYNPQPPFRRWVSSLVRGVTASPKTLVSADDSVFGLDAAGRPFTVTPVRGVLTVIYPCPLPSPGEAQRRNHAAVLQAFGIDSLTSLGSLSLGGDLVPEAGLLRPRPDLVAGTIAIQAARRAVLVNNQRVFVPLAVNANLLTVEPFPFKTTAAKTDVPLDTAYIAASSLNLADDTHLILKFPNRHLVILAEELTVGKNVTVTYERQPATPPDKPGKPGKPATPAVPNPFSKGNRGTNGTAGSAGAKGWSFTGSPAPEVEVWVLNMTGSPAFDLRGQDGGAGGAGGDGGDGGDGSGGSSSDNGLIFCDYGPGDGGDGGDGAKAGAGGSGGDGAPGGRLTFYAPSPVIATFASGFFVTVDGGSAGPGGIPGTPGAGGVGGPVGQVRGSACNKPAAMRKAGKPGAQGAAASQGATGQAGLPQAPTPISFLPILPVDFVQTLDKPALESLTVPGPQSGRAFETQTVSAKGKHFSSGDTVLIDNGAGGWVFCTTQLLGDTLLTFQVPAVPGGLHTVLVEQTTSFKHSNAISLYVLPKLDITQPGPRIRPGATVLVKGTGFAPGMRAFLSGQESGTVSYVDPHTLQLGVVRPKAFPEPPNVDGDPADLALALADGTFSNSIPVLLDTYRIIVLGDSVAWGTGLQEPEKFSSLVAQRVKDLNQASNLGVSREERAHTGAILGLSLRPPSALGIPAIPGEVPTPYPTISEQLDLYANNPSAASVDLVLVDGCINDLGVFEILDPQRSPSDLAPEIEQGCHYDMLELLKRAGTRFPQARIVVNSYFAPLGYESFFAGPLLVSFLIAIDHPIVTVPGEIVNGVLKPGTRENIIVNSVYFEAKSSEQLALAVKDANQQLGSPRICFANPHFGSPHAALGPDPWLFGINADLSPQDNPVVASARKAACNQYKDRTDYATCVHASAGHPNITGAQRFAEAIFPCL